MTLPELTRDEAQDRARQVQVQRQSVVLDLTTGPDTFTTSARIEFSADDGGSTFVDFLGDSVGAVELNGEPVDAGTAYDGARVHLTGLRAQNVVRIDAVGRYMHTGEGVHRFVDPVDEQVYLYTQFEVADARRAFPVFDQPDLKTRFEFTITADASWEVVSGQPVAGPPTAAAQGARTWTFLPTEPVSSYITAFCAGPYAVVHDVAPARRGAVPLAIYCRQSLRRHLDADNLFDLVRRGVTFFEDLFDRDYPFAKYDQLFAPEYNAGAMENAGLVTIAEVYVFHSAVPESLVERRALTVLHELAHMWFGDLVTMRWWDDLWLNESFAEWASTTCQAEATRWESAWTTFSLSEKSAAYAADQLSSTHPIAADARNWSDVENNFDMITYAKGASVLKQLVAYVGREPFAQGLQAYFARYAWGNTDLRHLFDELEATSGRDLGAWSQTWLQTAGVNTLRPALEVADGRLTSLAVEQTAARTHPTLRPHRMGIGCYDLRDGRFERTSYVEVDVDGPRTEVPELAGAVRPTLLLLNDDDLAYAKIRLDEASLAAVLDHPGALTASLPRALVTAALWDMTRESETAATDFFGYQFGTLAIEQDSTAIKVALERLTVGMRYYVVPAKRAALRARFAQDLAELMDAASPGSDAQLQYARAYARMSTAEGDVARVRGLLDGSRPLRGLAVDVDMRWALLSALAPSGAVDDADVDRALADDRTAEGAERAAGVRAAYPTPEAKAAAWQRVFEDDSVPNATVAAMAAGFRTVHDPELLRPFVDRFHAQVRELWERRTYAIGSVIAAGMYPMAVADESLLAATSQWLEREQDAPDALRRLMGEHRDGVERALAAQARDAQD